jgi:hypothetical protein
MLIIVSKARAYPGRVPLLLGLALASPTNSWLGCKCLLEIEDSKWGAVS